MDNSILLVSKNDINFIKLLKFIIPTYLSSLFTTFYTIIDGIFVSTYVGTNALASINIVYPIVNVLSGIALAFATGGSAVAGIYIGGEKKAEANRSFSVNFFVSILLGCFVSLIILFNLSKTLNFLGASELTIAECKTYALWWLYATPIVIGKELCVYYIRVDGSPTYSLITALSGGLLNILLDYIFIGIFKMGVSGAALATIMGLLLSFVIGIYYFIRKHKFFTFTTQNLSILEAFRCMINGASEFVDQLAIAITTIVFNRTAFIFAGENGIAAVSIIMYLQFIFIGIYFGFSMGIAPPLSYAYGDKNIENCKKIEKYAYRFFTISPLIIYSVAYLLAPISISFFANTSSPVYAIAVSGMRIYGLGFLFSGINIFAAVRMMAYGKGYFSGLITFLRSFALLLLFLTILPQRFDLLGLWLAMPVAELLTLVVSMWFLHTIRVKKID